MMSGLALTGFSGKRRFAELTDKEILALAISAEEEDSRIYSAYAARLRADYPSSAAIFDGMAAEEDEHRRSLIDAYRRRYGDFIIPLRREHVADFFARRPVWLVENLGLERVRQEVAVMEREAQRFYATAAARATDAETRKLLGDLARAEAAHEATAGRLTERYLDETERAAEDLVARRQFILTWVQPGLAGLMDGSISTIAPIFATAFATHDPWTTFLVGLSASVGAGISMGFTEAVHDDGKISGRGSPWKRGIASGVMTAIGGLGHTVPYLIPEFWTATTIALIVVFVELWAIVWIQNRYMATPFFRATFQVVLGGALVLAAGILIGGT
jgi:rubrerythrin